MTKKDAKNTESRGCTDRSTVHVQCESDEDGVRVDTSQDRYESVQKPSTETTQYRFTNDGRSGKSTRLEEDNETSMRR